MKQFPLLHPRGCPPKPPVWPDQAVVEGDTVQQLQAVHTHFVDGLEQELCAIYELEEEDWEENNSSALIAAMGTLDDRSRDIVEQRWLSEQKSTLHELAAVYSISAECVRQIEKNAMDKIRDAMTIDSVILPDDIQ